MKNKSIFQQIFLCSLGIFLISCGGGGGTGLGNNNVIQLSNYSSIAEIAAILTIQK
jgi:hypothetical protein